jgi:hypothetical protein
MVRLTSLGDAAYRTVCRFGTWTTAASLLIIVGVLCTGCTTKGLTDPDAFAVYFNNDLPQRVMIALCNSDHSALCEHPFYRYAVAPNVSEPVNIAPDVRTEWAIETPSGRLLRCVLLYWPSWPGHDEMINLSAAPRWANPCPRTTPSAPH